MIYFFINVLMYLVLILLLIKYFNSKMNITSFLVILFNMNVYFLFIYKDINFIYGLFMAILSIILYYFSSLFGKQEIILINNGKINFHEVINNYGFSKLISYLKDRNIKLDEVLYCFLKNHKLIVVKNNKNKI